MNFFVDESISDRTVRLLSVFDEHNTLIAHKAHFLPGTKDVDWLPVIADWEPKPVLICGDGQILKDRDEKQVLRKCDIHFVYFGRGWMNANWNEFAWKIIKVWPDICRHVGRTRVATVWEVNFGGKVSALYPLAEL